VGKYLTIELYLRSAQQKKERRGVSRGTGISGKSWRYPEALSGNL